MKDFFVCTIKPPRGEFIKKPCLIRSGKSNIGRNWKKIYFDVYDHSMRRIRENLSFDVDATTITINVEKGPTVLYESIDSFDITDGVVTIATDEGFMVYDTYKPMSLIFENMFSILIRKYDPHYGKRNVNEKYSYRNT